MVNKNDSDLYTTSGLFAGQAAHKTGAPVLLVLLLLLLVLLLLLLLLMLLLLLLLEHRR